MEARVAVKPTYRRMFVGPVVKTPRRDEASNITSAFDGERCDH
jgi:hypothetical protein